MIRAAPRRSYYVKPTPHPCSACGDMVVNEFGQFDADLYEQGVLYRHFCPLPEIAPMYEERQPLAPKPARQRPTFAGGVRL